MLIIDTTQITQKKTNPDDYLDYDTKLKIKHKRFHAFMSYIAKFTKIDTLNKTKYIRPLNHTFVNNNHLYFPSEEVKFQINFDIKVSYEGDMKDQVALLAYLVEEKEHALIDALIIMRFYVIVPSYELCCCVINSMDYQAIRYLFQNWQNLLPSKPNNRNVDAYCFEIVKMLLQAGLHKTLTQELYDCVMEVLSQYIEYDELGKLTPDSIMIYNVCQHTTYGQFKFVCKYIILC